MDILLPDEFRAIQDFSEGLKEVFRHYAKNHPDKMTESFMNYILDVISLHLELAEARVGEFFKDVKKREYPKDMEGEYFKEEKCLIW